MKNALDWTWNMGRKLKIIKNEKHTLQDLKYGKKHSKTWIMRNAYYITWSMARKLIIMENKKHTLRYEIWQETLKNIKK